MADETPTNDRRLTTDPDRVREWAESHDVVPVADRAGEGPGYTLVHSHDAETGYEEHTWEEFATAFEDDDFVFVYHDVETTAGDELTDAELDFEFVDRDRAFEQVSLGREEFEDSLRQGETVTTEVVETQVVETEIVERDTIESKVVDSAVVERTVVDSELLSRDVVETEFVDDEIIEVTVEQRRLETIEEFERYTVESEVVDVDIDHDEELERERTETSMEVEHVQRSILESNLLRAEVTPDAVLEQEVIQSNRTEGDTVETELIERRLVEEEHYEKRQLRFVLEADELLTSEVVESELLEGELIDVEEYTAGEAIAAEQADSDMDVADSETMGATDAETDVTGSEAVAGTDSETVSGAGGEPGAEATIELSSDDQGKDVVDQRGETVGIVAEVDEQTAYIDPQPGLTDRLRARLNWGSHDDDSYPIQPAQITEVTDDAIVIRGEEEADRADHGEH